ncbi:Putative flippase GtrA (transmembrane translocase of bactoprenol-linked glucose) [Variovorax sp. YR752]|uniref:GtrA family protein n=1 Tax=Variovorax sp. YR752 TaxID=1884383 RepID=UPI000BD9D0B9|nr:GtrA family protein [Variovorax sp. YR752]SOD21582.1 Putative flippase GtrA (transmembrane translocase of bactoprenol-linked glucose) [Variovorax sp. YR752]
MKIGREFLSFALVGVIGLVVDVVVLYLLAPLLGWYGARVVSFLAAATTTWAFNRRYTFAASTSAGSSLWREYLGYLATMAAGAVLNYGAYVLTLHWVEGRWAAALGVALGSLAGMSANFLSARYLVFRSHRGG